MLVQRTLSAREILAVQMHVNENRVQQEYDVVMDIMKNDSVFFIPAVISSLVPTQSHLATFLMAVARGPHLRRNYQRSLACLKI